MLDDFNIFPPGVCFCNWDLKKIDLEMWVAEIQRKGALQMCSWMSFIGSGRPLRHQDSSHLLFGEKTCDWQSYSDLVPDLMVPHSCVFMSNVLCCWINPLTILWLAAVLEVSMMYQPRSIFHFDMICVYKCITCLWLYRSTQSMYTHIPRDYISWQLFALYVDCSSNKLSRT